MVEHCQVADSDHRKIRTARDVSEGSFKADRNWVVHGGWIVPKELTNLVRDRRVAASHIKPYGFCGSVQVDVNRKWFSPHLHPTIKRFRPDLCQRIMRPDHLDQVRIEFCAMHTVAILARQ